MTSVRDSKEYRIRQGRLDKIRGALIGRALHLANRVQHDHCDRAAARKVQRLQRLYKKAREHRHRLYSRT